MQMFWCLKYKKQLEEILERLLTAQDDDFIIKRNTETL